MKKMISILLLSILGLCIFHSVDVSALENGWEIRDGYTYYYENGELVKGVHQIENNWYHFGENSGQLKTDWSKTLDGREYYSDANGEIHLGWLTEKNQKYYITPENGILKGIHQIDNNWYHFGENSGQLKIGLSQLLDGRIYYSDSNGVLEQGWIHTNDQTYYFDLDSGAYKGIHQIGEDWYHFGEYSGQLKIGWSKLLDGRVYYSDQEGILQQGWIHTNDQTYYFDLDSGAYKGIHQIEDEWYHFGENSGQLKIGWSKLLDGRIYYANQEGVLQFGWITDQNQKYYMVLETGAYKGLHQIDNNWYHFGENSGQLKKGISQLLDGRIYYSDQEGVLQFGWITDQNEKYYIVLETGAYKGLHQIGDAWYHFGEYSGKMKKGWSSLLSGKIYYSNQEGVLQKGDLFIDNNWYHFGDDYSLQTGWQEINGHTYYFYADGTKARYISKIAGKRYEFSANGELQHSDIKIIADISFHNGVINWDELWASGEIDGVILRIGYSLGQDSQFLTYLSEARRLGIPYSVYHFSIAENSYEAALEANSLVGWYQNSGLTPSMGVFYDIESWYNKEDGHTSDGISIETYDSIISTYKAILNNNGINMSLYTGKYYAENRLSDYGRSQIGWIAQYASDCTYGGSYRGWQYTSKGSLPGISGNVDLSIFYY